MEGRIEIVIEKVFKIIAQYFDLITTNQIDFMCPVFVVAYDPTHDTPYSFDKLYRNMAGNGHQMSFKRLKDYLSGVTFEVISQKPQQITQHINKRGKKRAKYIPCKLQLVRFTDHVST